MPEQSERELVDKLIQKTKDNQVDWKPTSTQDQLEANFGDKYVIRLTRSLLGNMVLMLVTNAEGEELSKLTTLDEPRLVTLYESARHNTRKQIDDQLAELMKELDKPSLSETREQRARQIDEIMRDRDKK